MLGRKPSVVTIVSIGTIGTIGELGGRAHGDHGATDGYDRPAYTNDGPNRRAQPN